MMMLGVSKPITWETLLTSIMPTAITMTSISKEPTQAGQPNCCSMLEPA